MKRMFYILIGVVVLGAVFASGLRAWTNAVNDATYTRHAQQWMLQVQESGLRLKDDITARNITAITTEYNTIVTLQTDITKTTPPERYKGFHNQLSLSVHMYRQALNAYKNNDLETGNGYLKLAGDMFPTEMK